MQSDLFGNSQTSSTLLSRGETQTPKSHFLEGIRFSLRLDQALVMLIALLVVFVLVFSFGVEKGKRFALAELKAERTKRERIVQELRAKLFENRMASPTVLRMEDEKTPPSIPGANEISAQPAEGKYPEGEYTVQLVTFTAKKMVEKEIKKLMELGFQGFVIPSGRYLQVCINGFESRESARVFLRELKAQNLVPQDAYVRPIPR